MIAFDEGFVAGLKRKAALRLLAAAAKLQELHKADLSVANPYPHHHPSAPGEFPRARTFNLRDAATVEPLDPGEVARTGRVRVGYAKRGSYVVPLARRGRKTVLDTLAEHRAEVAAGTAVETS